MSHIVNILFMDERMPPTKKKYYQITSLEKGVKVLELLAEKSYSL